MGLWVLGGFGFKEDEMVRREYWEGKWGVEERKRIEGMSE